MIPLPRRLLRQTATVKAPKDSFYGGEFEKDFEIEGVYFEPTRSRGGTPYQEQNPVRGTLFMDPNVSKGARELPAGALVRVEGMESDATVSECSAFYVGDALHHWEVTLK